MELVLVIGTMETKMSKTPIFRGVSWHPWVIQNLFKRWINDEPCRETEVKTEKKRWIKHFRQSKKSRAQSQDLDGEGRKRSTWWHSFLVETGDIVQDGATFE